MALMQNTYKRNGIHHVRVVIPKDVRHHFGGQTEFHKTLATEDDDEALQWGWNVRKGFKDQIRAARAANAGGQPMLVQAPVKPVIAPRLNPDRAFDLIQRWKKEAIDQAYEEAFNGELPSIEDAVAYSDQMYALQQGKDPDGLQSRLAAILDVFESHPALAHDNVRQWLREAWLEAERHIARFRVGDFGQWSTEAQEAPQRPSQASAGAMKLTVLLDRFLASTNPAEADDLKNVWKRLVDMFGDVDADSITPLMADDFMIALKKFPVVRKPEIVALTMQEIIAQHKEGKLLAPKTVWKLAGLINRAFTWAAAKKVIKENPFASAMPKKPGKQDRVHKWREFTEAEVQTIFNAPMFKGFDGLPDFGYRKEPGHQIVKDEKWWLPVFAFWHGVRLEEIGGARMDEILVEDGIPHFDWRNVTRSLKTEDSRRRVPFHPEVIRLGWNEYLAERRKAGDVYVFPNLPHDADDVDAEASTRNYSKWWGRWMGAHGLHSPDTVFHSFRHTFVTECRGKIDEELRDFIVGHKGKHGEGRDYGKVRVKVLADALALMTYPDFPL